jgi:DNA-directed RNA polymerase subunit M/transcription elongation factor TFIIS
MSLQTTINNSPINHVPLPITCYKKPYNDVRRAKLVLFGSCFNEYPEFVKLTHKDKLTLIIKLERACFNTSINKANNDNIPTKWDVDMFVEIYHAICYKVSSNITKSGSVETPVLGSNVLNGSIDIVKVPYMTARELFPAKYVEIIDRLEMSKNVVCTVKTSTMYKCRRCHKNETTIENLYNRSLDEGVNLSVTCQACGYAWNA